MLSLSPWTPTDSGDLPVHTSTAGVDYNSELGGGKFIKNGIAGEFDGQNGSSNDNNINVKVMLPDASVDVIDYNPSQEGGDCFKDVGGRAFSSIGAIGANGLGPPPNGGLQILHIWSILHLCAHFGKPFHIIFQISTFY